MNQKVRRLRLTAFEAVNKLDLSLPRTKIALLMRAYSKDPPGRGDIFCPNPEAWWLTQSLETLGCLEAALRFLQGEWWGAGAALPAVHYA